MQTHNSVKVLESLKLNAGGRGEREEKDIRYGQRD